MTTQRAHLDWAIAFKWILATTVGWAVGLTLGLTVRVDVFVVGALLGTIVGATQWLVIRGRILHSGLWILSSVAGFAFGVAVSEVLGFPVVGGADFNLGFNIPFMRASNETLLVSSYVLGGPGAGSAMGVAIGSIQWLFLRRQLHRSGWWILATTVGLALGFLLGTAVSYTLKDLVTVGIATGAVVGISTGIPLSYLLPQQPVDDTRNPSS